MAATKEGWKKRREKYGSLGFPKEQLPEMKARMLKARRKSPTVRKGVPKSLETKRKISETVKQRWKEGYFRNSEKYHWRNGRNRVIKKEHDEKLTRLVKRVRLKGHTIIFVDMKKHERPDLITFYKGEVHKWDVKLHKKTIHIVYGG